jgi:hypothetical protein
VEAIASSVEAGAGAEDATLPAHAMDARINVNAEDSRKILLEEKGLSVMQQRKEREAARMAWAAAFQMARSAAHASLADLVHIPILIEQLKS